MYCWCIGREVEVASVDLCFSLSHLRSCSLYGLFVFEYFKQRYLDADMNLLHHMIPSFHGFLKNYLKCYMVFI